MGKPRAEKYEGENGRKREEELEMKIGLITYLCSQTQSVTRADQDFLLKQIFSTNFRKNKTETWAETSYLLFFPLHIKMQLFLSLTFSFWVCCSFLTKRPQIPERFILAQEVVKGECEMHFVLLCSITGKQLLHFWKNLPLVVRAGVEKSPLWVCKRTFKNVI